jgi:hypothetical protein
LRIRCPGWEYHSHESRCEALARRPRWRRDGWRPYQSAQPAATVSHQAAAAQMTAFTA